MTGPAPDDAAPSGAAVPNPAETAELTRVDAAVSVDWRGAELRFASESGDSPALIVDGNGVVGPSPMQLLLHSLAGCTASDVVDILTKGRVPFTTLTLRITATRAPDPPRRYTAIRLAYRVTGLADADRRKLERAVALSHGKYCSVLHSLREDIEMRTVVEAS